MSIGQFGLVSQTALNFTLAEGYSVFVGDLNITHCITALTLKRPIAEIGQAQSWTGSMSLSTPAISSLLAESLDDITNPARWCRGNHPVIFTLAGIRFATLRIIEYSYDEDMDTSDVDLGDILVLSDFRTPGKDYKSNFTACKPVSLSQLVEVALKESGIPSFSLNVSGTIPVPPDKPSGSWIAWAQSYLGERGYWLYCDPFEIVKIVQYPQTPQPITSLSRSEVENYERQKTLDFAPDKLTVVGVGEVLGDCCGSSFDVEIQEAFGSLKGGEDGNALIGRTTSRLVNKPVITGEQLSHYSMSEIRTIKTEQALGVVFPREKPGDGTLAVTSFVTETKRYNREGFLVEEKYSTDKMLGLCLPEAFPGDTTVVEGAEATRILYSDQDPSTSVISGLGDGKPAKLKPGQPGSGVLVYKQTETWAVMAEGTTASELEGGGRITGAVRWEVLRNSEEKESWRLPTGTFSAIGGGGVEEECTCDTATYTKRVSKRTQRVISARDIDVQGKYYKEDQDYYYYGGLIPVGSEGKTTADSSFPTWARLSSPCPVRQKTLSESTTFAPKDFSPFRERESTFQSSTINTSAEAKYLSSLLGRLAHQRRLQRLISLPIPEFFVRNSEPFTCLDVHEGRFICDAPAIVIGEDGAEISWTGNYYGAIPAVPRLPRVTVWIPTQDEIGGGLTALSYSEPVVVHSTDALALPVLGAGGTSPYSYSFSGLPPGVSVAGKISNTDPLTDVPPVIIGHPSTPGNYTVTVTVTDFCGVSVTSNVGVDVLPLPVPTLPVIERNVSYSTGTASALTEAYTAPIVRLMPLTASWASARVLLSSSQSTAISAATVSGVVINRRFDPVTVGTASALLVHSEVPSVVRVSQLAI